MYQNCCKKCGSTNLHTEVKGNSIGLYCSDCGAWIKWLGKDELRAFQHSQTSKKETCCEHVVHTNADRIRSMTDEELAEIMNDVVGFETGPLVPFCQNKKECDKELDKGNLIPDAWCERCLLEWLRSESED